MTSDGSFGEFGRSEYEKVEERLVEELKSLDKPFVIVVNTAAAGSQKTKTLVEDLANKYEVGVIAANVSALSNADLVFEIGRAHV